MENYGEYAFSMYIFEITVGQIQDKKIGGGITIATMQRNSEAVRLTVYVMSTIFFRFHELTTNCLETM